MSDVLFFPLIAAALDVYLSSAIPFRFTIMLLRKTECSPDFFCQRNNRFPSVHIRRLHLKKKKEKKKSHPCDFLPPDGPSEKVSAFETDLSRHTTTRVRRQTLSIVESPRKVQGVTAKQDCDGILLQWDRMSLPFRYEWAKSVQTIPVSVILLNGTSFLRKYIHPC